jgi:hypothetical protein
MAFTPEQRQKAKETQARAREQGRRPLTRKQKMAAFAQSFAAMRQEFPWMALSLIDRAEGGSLIAAVQLKCLECSAFQRLEIRNCTITSCPLYPHRPYQQAKGRNSNDPPSKAPVLS